MKKGVITNEITGAGKNNNNTSVTTIKQQNLLLSYLNFQKKQSAIPIERTLNKKLFRKQNPQQYTLG